MVILTTEWLAGAAPPFRPRIQSVIVFYNWVRQTIHSLDNLFFAWSVFSPFSSMPVMLRYSEIVSKRASRKFLSRMLPRHKKVPSLPKSLPGKVRDA